MAADESGPYAAFVWKTVADQFAVLGRGPDAEALVAKLLERYGKKENSTYELASAAALLIDVYRRAGRYDDIVVMLDRYKRWSGTDLANLDQSAGDVPLQLAAAEAFTEALALFGFVLAFIVSG